MSDQQFEIIDSRNLFLKNDQLSSEVVFSDPDGGNMYFTFELRYTDDKTSGKTRINVIDSHHAQLIIDTLPNAVTKPDRFIELGTFGPGNRPLYIGFVVQPHIGNEHNVLITFYTRKEEKHGTTTA